MPARDGEDHIDFESIWTTGASIRASTATHSIHASTATHAKVLEIKGTSTTAEARKSGPQERPTKAPEQTFTTSVDD